MTFRCDILAIVVSYNGAAVIASTVDALVREVGRVHIVDNGSDAQTQRALGVLEAKTGVTVERLGSNRGIGAALNRGLERAAAEARPWILTMDQDSVVQPGFIDAFAAAVAHDRRVVCLTPRIDTGVPRGGASADGEVAYAITSGNLVRREIASSIGGFDEGMFIDCVDFDFSLRLRAAGFRIQRVDGAHLLHRLGDEGHVPRVVRRFYVQHSPVRRYYMFRNYFYLAERHVWRFPLFILKLGVLQCVLALLALRFDPRPRDSAIAMLRGTGDWMRRRLGAMPGVPQ